MSIYSKYGLSVCELYHPYFHGKINNGCFQNWLYGSYLSCFDIELDELYDDNGLFPTDNTGPYGIAQARQSSPNITHPFIRNHANITSSYSVDIVEFIYLDTGHVLCILKTFWLKIFQRKWKKIYRQLQERIRKAKNPRRILYGRIIGKIIY